MKKSQFRASLLAASALSVSIASQLHAAAFVSTVGGGIWEDPTLGNTWTTAGFPDTFLNDSATITGGAVVAYDDLDLDGDGGVSTPATSYTIALGLAPGGLSVANGNSITIEGGSSLTQVNLNHEIRIGEGAGFQSAGVTPSGTGTLNINGGSSFFSGSALGVAVGSDIDNDASNGTGNGKVNLNEGLFVMELGAPGFGITPAGLGVGIEGATGVFNVGDGVGVADATLDLLASNSSMGVGVTNQLPGSIAGNGTVNVKVDGVIAFGAGGLTFGDTAGGVGLLNVDGGTVGSGAASTGEVRIGSDGGTGTLTMTAGLINTGGDVNVGRGAGSTGLATISGGVLQGGAGALRIGTNSGTGTLTLSGSGLIDRVGANHDIILGNGSGSTGIFTQSGGTLDLHGGHMLVGEGGNGTYNITAGTLSNASWIHVGSLPGSTGTVNVNFSNPADVLTTGDLYVGNNSATGTVNVDNGSLKATGVVQIGRHGGGTGTLTVTGPNSSVEGFTGGGLDDFFRVGMASGHGIVNVTGGGKINTNGGWFTLGENNGSVGEATFSGAGSSLNSRGLIVGWNGLASGTLNITDNAVVTNTGHEVSIGRDYDPGNPANSPTGIINIISGGTLNAGTELRVGHNTKGTVNINSGTLNTSSGGWSILGEGGAAEGTVNMTNGVINDHSQWFSIAQNPGSRGTFTQDGASTTTIEGELNIARDRGVGELNVNGGTFTVGGWTVIGRDNNGNAGGLGTINVTNGATFQHLTSGSGDLLLGWKDGSTAKLNVNSGGKVIYNWWFRAAIDPGSKGDVVVDGPGSRVDLDTGRVYIGEQGTGTLTVTNGGVFSQTNGDQFNVGGNDASSTGNGLGTLSVSGTGSKVSTNNFIRVGFGNTGADPAVGIMNLGSGGTIESGGWIGIGHDGGDGTLSMTGGTLKTGSELYVGIDDNGHTRQTTGQATISGSSSLDIGALYIGRNGGRGVVDLNSGTMVISREGRIGGGGIGSGGGVTTGTLNISGPTSTVSAFAAGGADDFFRVGHAGGNGTVNISGGGKLNTNAGWFTLGENDGSVGQATVTGFGSTLTSFGLIVGWNGLATGTLNIANNAVVNNVGHELSVGRDFGGANSPTGIINITTGGTLNTVETRIGHNTTGTLNITDGNFHNTGGWGFVGTEATSHGTVNMSGASTATFSDQLLVGHNGGQGVYNQTGGTTTVATEFNLGRTGGNGTLNLSGGVFNVNGWTTAGKDGGNGSGTINITNGALFNHPQSTGDLLLGWTNGSTGTLNVNTGGKMIYNWWFRVGVDPGSQGDVVVDGPGSSISVDTGRVYIGEKSRGTLTISNGATFTHTNADEFNVGGEHDSAAPEGGDGTVTVTGAGSTLSVNNFIRVGLRNTDADPGVGVMNVSNSGAVSTGGWVGIGHEGGDGTLNLTGGTITTGTEFYVGIDDNGRNRTTTGKANITAGSISAGTTVWIGRNGGIGDVAITGAAAASLTSANEMFIGDGGVGSGGTQTTGTLTISNPLAVVSSVNQIVVGRNGGLGTVNQSAGSLIETNQWLSLGVDAGSTGTYNLLGGTVTSNFIEVGADGAGTFNVSGTGSVTANQFTVGTRGTGVGIINVNAGGLLTSNGTIFLGGDQGPGSGVLNIIGGTVQTLNVTASLGSASLTLSGGTLRAGANEGDFLRGFTNSGGHSAINLAGAGGTIDSNGFDVRITQTNVFADTDILSDGLAGTVLNKTGLGTLTIESAVDTDGTVAVHAVAGTLDFEESQTLDGLFIDGGATVTLSALSSPPAPAEAAAALFAGASSLGGVSAQGVPEPGTIGLLLVSALGMFGRRHSRKGS